MTSRTGLGERIATGELSPAFLDFDGFLGATRYAQLEGRYRVD